MPTCAELHPGEGVDGHGVGLDSGDVADDDLAALGEKHADAIAEAGEVGTSNRAANRERDLEWPCIQLHRPVRPVAHADLIGLVNEWCPSESKAHALDCAGSPENGTVVPSSSLSRPSKAALGRNGAADEF